MGSSNYITNFAGEVSQHTEYMAFGETFIEEHKDSHNSPYKFNGKELDEESGLYYYGARYYDPRISIWASVDPLVEKTFSSYGYCNLNPVNLVDPDGKSPWPIIIRSFAPWENFGLVNQYEGDGRKYSTKKSYRSNPESFPRARIHHTFTFDPEKREVTNVSTWSSSSAWRGGYGRETSKDTKGTAVYTKNKDNNFGVKSKYSGSLPLHPGAEIDVNTFIQIKETKNNLNISVEQNGDNFPTAETIIYDSSGVGLYIGVAPANGTLPEVNVPGDNTELMMRKTINITLDDNKNFKSVKYTDINGKAAEATVHQWNAMWEKKPLSE